MDRNKIAVISTGNGGQSMAAYFADRGYRVSLYAREQERVDMFPSRYFTLGGKFDRTVCVETISCSMQEVLSDAYLVMVTTPSQYHAIAAKAMAPWLKDGQIVVLNPGRTFGTYVFDKALRENGCRADILLGETDTFIFTCRCTQPGHPFIYEIKRNLRAAAHDPQDTPRLVSVLGELFPEVRAAESVLETGLSNIGMIFHPLPVLMNITRIEAGEPFRFYLDGITPMVSEVMEQLDSERVNVADKLGVRVLSARDWVEDRYGSAGSTLYERIQNTNAYREVMAPTGVNTRYICEDVQTGCVPLCCLGRQLGVKTQIADTVVSWASAVYGRDFRTTGRNEQAIDYPAVVSAAVS